MPKIRLYPRPTITGPQKVRVGSVTYGLPADSRVVRTHVGSAQTTVAYALVSGRVHCFVQAGQIALDPNVEAALGAKYFALIAPQRSAVPQPKRSAVPSNPALRVARRRLAKKAGTG